MRKLVAGIVVASLLVATPSHAVRGSSWALTRLQLVTVFTVLTIGTLHLRASLGDAHLDVGQSSFLLQVAALTYAGALLAGNSDRLVRIRYLLGAGPELLLLQAWLYQMLLLASASGPQAITPAATPGLADITLTGATVKGKLQAIKKFTKLKGTLAVKWAGTIASGPDAGKSAKGKLMLALGGDRV